MKTRIAAAFALAMLGLAAPATSALAGPYDAPHGRYMAISPYGADLTGQISGDVFGYGNRNPATCPMSSAAEGNANQQNFPVKQYGQTAGGNRC